MENPKMKTQIKMNKTKYHKQTTINNNNNLNSWNDNQSLINISQSE